MCVRLCVCVCARARACVRACVRVLTGHGGLDFVAAILVAGVGVEELAVGLVEEAHSIVHARCKQAIAVMRKAHARDGVYETV